MKIEQVERWIIDDKEFTSEDAARRYEEDRIGEFMEKYLLVDTMFSTKDRLRLHANILKYRIALLSLLGD
jgi:hypothetical protein